MVRNFGGRLQPLGITVRELTGDMSLTKQEILKTQGGSLVSCMVYGVSELPGDTSLTRQGVT